MAKEVHMPSVNQISMLKFYHPYALEHMSADGGIQFNIE